MRYFIISYAFGNGELGYGICGSIGESYPNLYTIKKDIKMQNVNILNIIEVNKEDYNTFWEK